MAVEKGEKIVSDGGITKILINPGIEKVLKWEKGSNAIFKYIVHAYVKENPNSTHIHTASCSHKSKEMQHMNDVINLSKHYENQKSVNESDAPPIRRLISDSSKNDPEKPFELRIGYGFSVKALEICVKSMKVGERSRFLCLNEYTEGFVSLEKALRKDRQNIINASKGIAPVATHSCGAHAFGSLNEYPDLLNTEFSPLEFDIELIDVQDPTEYVREPWEMNNLDKIKEAKLEKEQGGKLYQAGNYANALQKYQRALVLLESLSNSADIQDNKRDFNIQTSKKDRESWLKRQDSARVKRGDLSISKLNPESDISNLPEKDSSEKVDSSLSFSEIEILDINCRLNYAACQLKLKNYTPVIIQCSEVIKRSPKNPKAYFRRGQAYHLIGRDIDLAKKDFENVRKIFQNDLKYEQDRQEWNELKQWEKKNADRFSKQNENEKKMFSNIFA